MVWKKGDPIPPGATPPLAVAENPVVPVVQKKTTTEATVLDSQGQTVRVYSLAVHGENFEELAQMFISHHPNKTVVVR